MINKIGLQNNYKYNISFGLNENNKRAIDNLRKGSGDRVTVIESFDMSDPDIQPCLDEFTHLVDTEPSMYEEMNAILKKLDTLSKKSNNKNGLKECLSSFVDCWSKLFLSTRTYAAAILDKVGIQHPAAGHLSRTATNPLYADIVTRNIKNADKYIKENVKQGECPDKNLLKELHKIITKDLKFEAQDGTLYDPKQYSGIIERSKEDKLLLKEVDNKYEERLDAFMAWLKRNYEKDDVFLLGAQSYKKLLGISPFYDANGRTIRAFMDALLYSRGYQFKNYPSNYAEVRSMPMNDLRSLFEDNCEEV